MDIPAGREVILPSFTIVSCLEAVLRNGLIPVLVDCDSRTYCMDIADVRRKITSQTFGADERFRHEDRGWNYRMTNLQAAMGCAQLERIEQFLSRKLDMANRYNEGLRNLPLQLTHVESWAKTSVWMYAVVLEDSVPFDAIEFAGRLMVLGVQTRPFFMGMHEQPVYQNMGFFQDDRFQVTERIYQRGLYLPSGQAITDEQIEQVISCVHCTLA